MLVGITRLHPEGDTQEQFFGTVMDLDPQAGITLRLEGSRAGEIYRLPPHLQAFSPAPPGAYRLRETGETVTDPDFLSTWTIAPPEQ